MTEKENDVESKALALFERSLDIVSADRAAWIQTEGAGDDAVVRKALTFLSIDSDSKVALRTGGAFNDSLDDTKIPQQVGSYRVIELIGRGGMGAVYRGERAAGDFEHDVAIKVVRPGALSPKLVARFALERQTLAGLNHPNIARLYDGGELATGEPYIVMEFIDGLPITEWADKNDLSLKQRLHLFSSACSAVAHAHQNLIIHRDITPSNVLVDKAGHVKLIDFGIAKPVHLDTDDTRVESSLDSLSFTPGFAAPERSQGSRANTLSDVYSLGKLLAALVNNLTKDPDIAAIIGKAASDQPEGRYTSVNAFIEDISNHLVGNPVEATKGGRAYKVRKFVGRHTFATALAGATLVGLVAALTVTLMQYSRAEAARLEADSRFSDTRELTSFLLNDLSEDLTDLPGTLPLQKKVSETSARYLDILAGAAATDPSLDIEHAQGRRQLGDLLTQSGGRNLGNPVEGLRQFDISLAILRRLAKSPDASPEVRKMLADEIVNRAYIQRFYFDDSSTMAEATSEAGEIYTALLRDDPANIEIEAALLDIRFERWLAQNVQQGSAELDDEILSIKSALEDLFADDLENNDYIISYWSFLYLAGNAISLSEWNPPYGLVPISDRETYETVRDWVQTGFDVARKRMEENPSNPEDIYTYFWALETLVRMTTMALEWRPSVLDVDTRLSPYSDGRQAIARAQKTDPGFAESLRLANELQVHLDTAKALLERLRPFDEGTYSYLQLVYATHKNQGYVDAGLGFNLERAEAELARANSVPDAFLDVQPDNVLVLGESIYLRIQRAQLMMRTDEVYKADRRTDICSLLEEIDALRPADDATTLYTDSFFELTATSIQLKSENSC